MFSLFFINGCSHSAGSEIEGSGIGEGPFNRENCFGSQIAKYLGIDKINLSYPGGSNDYILNSTILWCLENPQQAKNTYFLIHWTSANRTDIYTKSFKSPKYQDWIFDSNYGHVHADHYCPNFEIEDQPYVKKLSKYLFLNETNWEINKFLNIIKLQTFFQNNNYDYSFHNAFTPCKQDKRFKKYVQLINQNKFKNMFDQNETFYYWALNQGHDIAGQKYWHHKLPAHIEYANKLINTLFV